MNYERKAPPGGSEGEVKALQDYIVRELEEIEKAFREQDFVVLSTRFVIPSVLVDGLTVLADGTSWDPGSGQGVYTYYNGAWHKLG